MQHNGVSTVIRDYSVLEHAYTDPTNLVHDDLVYPYQVSGTIALQVRTLLAVDALYMVGMRVRLQHLWGQSPTDSPLSY